MVYLKTTLETNIAIGEMEIIYSKDYDNIILNKGKEIYEKKCYKNQYIYSIDSIVKRSLCKLIKRNADGFIRFDIIYNITIIKPNIGDIICNVTVDNIINNNDQNILHCNNDHILAFLDNTNKLDITIDQVIPIIVGGIEFNIFKPKILINSYPFIPILTDNKWYKVHKMSELDIKYLTDNILTTVTIIENKRDEILKIKNNRWNYFDNLLYKYKKDKVNTKLIDLLDFQELGFIKLDDTLHLSNKKILYSKSEEEYLNDNMINIYEMYLMNYIKYIDTVNQLSTCYHEEDIFNKHQNIFKIYSDNKH